VRGAILVFWLELWEEIAGQTDRVAEQPPVGAAVAANTGAAGAMYRVACFAGLPAPTQGIA